MTGPEYAQHNGEHFTNAAAAIEQYTLPVILNRVKRGVLRVYRIPGVEGKFFRTKDL